jgi:Na+-transporting NADH:ubiquinone oxidoreductase subunit F
MIDVLLGITMFTTIVILLSLAVMAARSILAPPTLATITINGDRSFEARSRQKLLDVLHDNGILVPSACAGAGTCGLCKVAVKSGGGEVLPTEKSKLDAAALRSGQRLACQVVVREDLEVQIPDDMLNTSVLECTVSSARFLSPLIREVVLTLPERSDFRFQAGSFVQIEVPPHDLKFADFDIPDEHVEVWDRMSLQKLESHSTTEVSRAYSIANRPQDAGTIVLNIRLALPPPANPDAPPGIGSSYLFGLKPGDPVRATGPFGSFAAQDSDREMIFIGGGVGMAPLRAIIFDQLERLGTDRKISFWYGARSKAELFYDDEFDELARKHKNFRWLVALSDPAPGDDWQGETGFVHDVVYENYLRAHAAPEDCEYYLCGPPLMIRAVVAMLQGIGVEQDSIFNDDFGS